MEIYIIWGNFFIVGVALVNMPMPSLHPRKSFLLGSRGEAELLDCKIKSILRDLAKLSSNLEDLPVVFQSSQVIFGILLITPKAWGCQQSLRTGW